MEKTMEKIFGKFGFFIDKVSAGLNSGPYPAVLRMKNMNEEYVQESFESRVMTRWPHCHSVVVSLYPLTNDHVRSTT